MSFFRHSKILVYIIALQEAFTAILPFLLLSSVVTLLYIIGEHIVKVHALLGIHFIDLHILQAAQKVFRVFSEIAVVISIAYFIAKRMVISQIISILLSLSVFITVHFIKFPVFPLKLYSGFEPAALIVPILSTLLLSYFYPKLSLHLPMQNAHKHVYKLYDFLLAFFVVYVLAVLLSLGLQFFIEAFIGFFQRTLSFLSDTVRFFLRDLITQLFWYIGIHGSHITNAFFDKSILVKEIVPHLSFPEFNRLFVFMGGAGVGVALWMATLYAVPGTAMHFWAKVSSPFLVFNINELLIYSIVVFNRILFLPFILVPMLNYILGYLFLQTVSVHFLERKIAWMTPPIFNGYLKSGGDLRLMAFQLFLLTIDTLIYIHFLKKFSEIQSKQEQISIFKDKLNIRDYMQAGENMRSYIAYHDVIESNRKLDEMFSFFDEKNLRIYYQPKKRLDANRILHFEALIRYSKNGKITGPFFLDAIEKAGLAPVMDIWVSEKIKEDLLVWKHKNFFPHISINLHPDTLLDNAAVNTIIRNLKNEQITVEVIERSFLYGKNALENLKRLKKTRFKVSIDDFGTGYSNLATIIQHEIDELKLDKALVSRIKDRNGYIVCKKIVEMCHELGYEVVAEGVETYEQYRQMKEIGVNYIQGYYCAPALPQSKIINISEHVMHSC